MAQKEAESENTFGVGEEILIYAFRYCLTRQSYAVMDGYHMLKRNWDSMSFGTRRLIQEEIKNHLERNAQWIDRADEGMWARILRLPA